MKVPCPDAKVSRRFASAVRRELGVYFTPSEVVGAQVRLTESLLRRLGCGSFEDERVLVVDPACGGGAYPAAILQEAPRARLQLYEVLPEAAALARARGLDVLERDALTVASVQAPIVVCIGNPPYRRGLKSSGPNLDGFASNEGVHRKNLYNAYVHFWRWAVRVALEERKGPAIVCLITPSSYLRGPAFAGMRSHLRRAFDELWVIDLEGDDRAARPTENVFPVRTPVAIGLGVRYGISSTQEAPVHYARISGRRAEKLAALAEVRSVDDLSWVTENAGRSFRPTARSAAYFGWPALTDIFPWQVSGAQLKRTWPIGITPEVLRIRWKRLLELPLSQRAAAFGPTRDRDINSSPGGLPPISALDVDAPPLEPTRYAYRPFDRQWVLPDPRLGDFLRAPLWRTAGGGQLFLTSMLTNVLGPGPAAIATALVPDMDHFRGSFGARNVIPLWRDAACTLPNVGEPWLEFQPRQLMAYCYALLVSRTYVERFAEELRTPGPRVPVTTDAALFRRGVELGERLFALHTYGHVARGRAEIRRTIGPELPQAYAYDGETLSLGAGQIAPIDESVWSYSVSGYRVLPNWLRRRVRPSRRSALDQIQPETWTHALTQEVLELVWLLEATLALEPALDALLDGVL